MGSILIVGAGIGGLTAARALSASGHRVTVLEQAPSSAPAGAGLALPPSTAAALSTVGVDVAPHAQRVRMQVGSGPRSRTTAPGTRLALPRSTLHDLLLADLDPAVDLRLGHPLTALEADASDVWAEIDEERTRFDLAIGADGLRSTTRTLLGLGRPLRYTGRTCWRTILEPDELAAAGARWPGHLAAESWGTTGVTATTPGLTARTGIVPVGGGRLYVYLVLTALEGTSPGRWPDGSFDWADSSERAVVRAARSLPTSRLLLHDLHELDRVTWGRGRVVLLGDAAHAVTPDLGHGATLAIHDALALARAVDRGLDGALARYRRRRTVPVHAIQRASRTTGAIAHLQHPWARSARDTALAASGRLASRR